MDEADSDEVGQAIACSKLKVPYVSAVNFTEYAIDSKNNNKIVLYYGVRSKDLLLFTDVLSECENKLSNFKKVIFIEELESDVNNKYRKGILDVMCVNDFNLLFAMNPGVIMNNFMITIRETFFHHK